MIKGGALWHSELAVAVPLPWHNELAVAVPLPWHSELAVSRAVAMVQGTGSQWYQVIQGKSEFTSLSWNRWND